MPTTLSPAQFQALYGTGQPTPLTGPNTSGLPSPTTSVAPGGGNPSPQTSLPAIPQPPATLALPNPTPNIIQAQEGFQNQPIATGPTGPTTLTAAQFQAQYGNVAPSGPTGASGGSGVSSALANFAKGIFSAPATIIARPFQAAAELAGASADQVDAATKKIPVVGGLVAPVDRNAGDVEKDVGNATQTVALGLGDAPIAAGALFGGGSSVAQGNKLFSTQTAVDTGLGAISGKLLQAVGQPLLNGAGKVIGTITPQVIKDVIAGGTDAITAFAAQHDIPLVGAVTKPLSEGIQNAASAVDNTINKTVSNAAGALKGGIAAQYPDLDPAAHYVAINQRDIVRPTAVNEPRFAVATRVYNDAANRGIDLGDQATKLGIQHDQLAEGNRYNTLDTVDNIRNGNYEVSNNVIRPAIQQVQHGVPRISTTDVKNSILNNIDSIPNSQLSPEDRAYMTSQVNKRYAPGSAADLAHPNGYNLEDLHDSRIVSQTNGKFKKDGSALENRPARLSRIEGTVFSDLFDSKAPAELQGVRGELEKNFKLANYLEALHGKQVPQGITQKAVRLFGRAIGGMVGSKVGGFPGFLFGSRGGDMLFNAFETLPNPIKASVLTKAFANKAEPEVYTALAQHLGQQEAERLMRPALPAAGESSAKAPASPTLFSTSNGRSTPSLQEAIDISNAESKLKTPTTNTKSPAYKLKTLAAQENQGPYVPPKNLPVIDTGKPTSNPKSLNDIRF